VHKVDDETFSSRDTCTYRPTGINWFHKGPQLSDKPVVPNLFRLAAPYREKHIVCGTQW